MGRQKIQIKKIEKKSSLEVTFSKRRIGLFKKAGELCILCSAEAAVIVFSPGRRAFVFGHPSADAIIDRFLHRETNSRALVPAGQVHGYVQRQYLEALGRLEVKREQEETVGGDGEEHGLNELEQFRGSLEKLRKKVADRVEEMTMIMMMESVMVEYAAPPQEYNSSGVLHGHDLAAHGIPHGFDFGFGFDGHLF
ncbi:hypothetical protein PVL29_009158 [Vitis rotundifolia]|uniref:MADS-box domain-containing protein n=1 Tax=Vitis rotundifolia TaxID=103349 RepID=A0AA38ZXY3_VITRO|nr:hypothetical protein PVL29_009158 [Vitis rotundifolia]